MTAERFNVELKTGRRGKMDDGCREVFNQQIGFPCQAFFRAALFSGCARHAEMVTGIGIRESARMLTMRLMFLGGASKENG